MYNLTITDRHYRKIPFETEELAIQYATKVNSPTEHISWHRIENELVGFIYGNIFYRITKDV